MLKVYHFNIIASNTSGTVLPRFLPLVKEQKIRIELALKSNFITIHNDVNYEDPAKTAEHINLFKQFWSTYENEPFKGRNIIVTSLCPEVCLCISLSINLNTKGNGSKYFNSLLCILHSCLVFLR